MADPKSSAHSAVLNAIKRGDLDPQPCEVGGDCRGDIQAHHDDYAKPLEVRWLCRSHHQRLHHPEAKPIMIRANVTEAEWQELRVIATRTRTKLPDLVAAALRVAYPLTPKETNEHGS